MSAMGGKRTLEAATERQHQSIGVIRVRCANVLPQRDGKGGSRRPAGSCIELHARRHIGPFAATCPLHVTLNPLVAFPLTAELDEGIPAIRTGDFSMVM